MSEDDRTVLVVMPVMPHDTPETHVEGSKPDVTCEDCGLTCWIAPTGRELVALNPDLKIVCVTCALKSMDAETTVMPPTDIQVSEIGKAARARGQKAPTREDLMEMIYRRFGPGRKFDA